MKGNVWIDIGIGLIVICGLYFVCKKMTEKKETVDEKKNVRPKVTEKGLEEDTLIFTTPTEEEKSAEDILNVLGEEKLKTARDIKNRHEEAGEVMRKALESIQCEQIYSESENKKTIDEMNNQLDELMK